MVADVLLSIGPGVRNPSAYVTRKLSQRLPQLEDKVFLSPCVGQSPEEEPPHGAAGIEDASTDRGSKEGSEAASRNKTPDVFMVHWNGVAQPLTWWSQKEAVRELLNQGVLDEGSADFLSKAPENEAKEIVSCLGPDVRNPSAFVTRRLKSLRLGLGPEPEHLRRPGAEAGVPNPMVSEPSQLQHAPLMHGGWVWPAQMWQADSHPEEHSQCHAPHAMQSETLTIHHNGAPKTLLWHSKEQAIEQLVGWGVLDEICGDYMMKASEHEAKTIISCLGPDVRNPSAFVTRKLRELQREGGSTGGPEKDGDVVSVYVNGAQLKLPWHNKGQALRDLVGWGVLDEGSADLLMEAPEQEAKDIVSSMGPEVRNPFVFVTKRLRELRQAAKEVFWEPTQDQHSHGFSGNACPAGPAAFFGRNGGGNMFGPWSAPPMMEPPSDQGMHPGQTITVYNNGVPVTVMWQSQAQALQELLERGVLDQRSADFLVKIPEASAWEILAALGPDVRNPSAFVTREARKMMM